ncbi:serine protease [Allomyces arbusculus]|nr:serine protease [Allomyces arbusculus]
MIAPVPPRKRGARVPLLVLVVIALLALIAGTAHADPDADAEPLAVHAAAQQAPRGALDDALAKLTHIVQQHQAASPPPPAQEQPQQQLQDPPQDGSASTNADTASTNADAGDGANSSDSVSTSDTTDPEPPIDTSALTAGSVTEWFNQAQSAVESLLRLAAMGENYIVTIRASEPVDSFFSHIKWLEQHLSTDFSLGKIVHKYNFGDHVYYGYSGTFHPSVVSMLRALPIVEHVDHDHVVSVSGPTTTQTGAPWGLARICRASGPVSSPLTYTYQTAGSGAGVDAYILDTGINTAHVDFRGRAVWAPQVFSASKTFQDNHGHGTHVAGTIGSATYGVAKSVRLVAVKVLDDSGNGPWSNVIAGINYVVNQYRSTKRPSVINISISGTKNSAFNSAISAAISAGVHVIVAAGNDAKDACNYSPSTALNVVSVGAINPQEQVAVFSNYGSCVTVFAPGQQITSTYKGSTTATMSLSGTSMASPHVAGTVASLLSQVLASNRAALTPAQVRNFLIKKSLATVKNVGSSPNRMLYLNPAGVTLASF